MKALFFALMTALAMTASAQLPANGFDPDYAMLHWTALDQGDDVYYLSNQKLEENNTWAFIQSTRMFIYLFSNDAYGYRKAYSIFAKIPGQVEDRSFFPSFVDGHLDYNNVALVARNGSGAIEIYKRFDGKVACITFDKQSAQIWVGKL